MKAIEGQGAVSDTHEVFARRAEVRESRLEGLGICTIVLGVAAIVVYFVPGLDEIAWMPGLIAIALGALDLQLKVSRRRYAILGMMLGVIGFSWSFAMMLFGSAR